MTLPSASALIVSATMAVAAGLVGAYALMRRLTLAADAISHVALPGIGVALMIHVQPILGALVMLLLGATLIWDLGRRTHLATETITGVVFATALAVGSMITPGEELIDALFGDPSGMSPLEAVLGVVAALGIATYILWRRNAMVLSLVSREVAHTAGINVDRLDLEYLLIFALTVALGLRYLGALLMGSLVIIPPAAARRLAGGLRGMLVLSALVSLGATLTGMFVAPLIGQKTGPVIVVAAASLFLLSLVPLPGVLRRRAGPP